MTLTQILSFSFFRILQILLVNDYPLLKFRTLNCCPKLAKFEILYYKQWNIVIIFLMYATKKKL